MSRARPWLVLGLSAVPILVALWWWRSPAVRGGGVAPRSSDPAPSQAAPRGSSARSGGGGAAKIEAGPLVRARIVSAVEGPLSSGRVELRCPGQPDRVEGVSLSAEGRFETGLCAGPTCVRLRHPSYEQSGAWMVEAGQSRELSAELGPRVGGRVRGSSGEEIASASLLLHTPEGRRASGSTDLDGEFLLVLPRLRPCDGCDIERGPPNCRLEASTESVSLFVLAPDFAPAEFDVELGSDTELELLLPPPAAVIEGRVLGVGGQAFTSRTSVFAVNIEREHERHVVEADTGGHFEFSSLAPARYRLRAVRDGLELASAELEPGEKIDLRADRSVAGERLQLRVLDADAQPVADARVDGGPFRAARTDPDGRVEAADVLPDHYELRVRAGECPIERVSVHLAARAHSPASGPQLEELRLPSGCGTD